MKDNDLKYLQGRMEQLLSASSEAWDEYERISKVAPHGWDAFHAYEQWDWIVREQRKLSPWLQKAQEKAEKNP